MQRRMTMKSLGLASLSLGLIASIGITSLARAGYRDEVLADDPELYYEFNEAPVALQVIDTTGKLNTDGSNRNSQFLGTREKSLPLKRTA